MAAVNAGLSALLYAEKKLAGYLKFRADGTHLADLITHLHGEEKE